MKHALALLTYLAIGTGISAIQAEHIGIDIRADTETWMVGTVIWPAIVAGEIYATYVIDRKECP